MPFRYDLWKITGKLPNTEVTHDKKLTRSAWAVAIGLVSNSRFWLKYVGREVESHVAELFPLSLTLPCSCLLSKSINHLLKNNWPENIRNMELINLRWRIIYFCIFSIIITRMIGLDPKRCYLCRRQKYYLWMLFQ